MTQFIDVSNKSVSMVPQEEACYKKIRKRNALSKAFVYIFLKALHTLLERIKRLHKNRATSSAKLLKPRSFMSSSTPERSARTLAMKGPPGTLF